MPAERDRIHDNALLKERRRMLRKGGTPAEAALWKLLKGGQLHGRKFRRQHSVGPYVLDFYCPTEKLAVELDGAVHADPLRREYDAERQSYLAQQGIRVVRFENRRVFEEPGTVAEAVAYHFQIVSA